MNRFEYWMPLCLMLGVSICGCSGQSDSGRRDVSGMVMYDGAPLPYGTILFVPDKAKQHSGPAGRAEVVDGVFTTGGEGRSVIPGPHILRITGFSSRPPEIVDETGPNLEVKALFEDFAMEADVVEGTNDISIPKQGSN